MAAAPTRWAPGRPLRLGFLGTGWIGRQRMEALLTGAPEGEVAAVGVTDPDPDNRTAALALAPDARAADGLADLLELDLDGVVIATPSALHAEAAVAALGRGVAVFCQKPLARDGSETAAVLRAAAALGRPLGVDLSFRYTAAVQAIVAARRAGAVSDLHAVDLVFHNAYGPDKPWFLDPRLAGGGCLIDLGIHLVDLALWLTGAGGAEVDAAVLRRSGGTVVAGEVEDFAWAQLRTDTGVAVRLACSWFLPAGRDCVIEATLLGTEESLALVNRDGSFLDLAAERRRGTATEVIAAPPDAWGGRALLAWAAALGAGEGFDAAEAERLQATAAILDAIYDRGGASR